jgi:hypothetical protein
MNKTSSEGIYIRGDLPEKNFYATYISFDYSYYYW